MAEAGRYHRPMAPRPTSGIARRPDLNGARSCIAIGPADALLRPLKTSETVARDVVHDITSGHLQPGDSLPSETAMLEQYGVSRESLREGLRLLEVQGLIKIRRGPGGGPIVGTVDPGHLGRVSTLYYHMAGATYRELFEAWVMGEVLLGTRAARNPDADARMAAMKPYLVENHVDAGLPIDELVQFHTQFHGAVASLVGNRVLELTLQTAGQIVSHHVAVTADPRLLCEIIDAEHHDVAHAIAAGHAKRAGALMEEHIHSLGAIFVERMGDRIDDHIEWL